MSLGDEIFVFHEGRILQKGEPQEVYQRPASRYVAEFFGKTNFVEVTAAPDTAGRLSLRTNQGELAVIDAPAGAMPGTMVCVIRPEAWRIADVTAGQGLRGRVRERTFIGDRQELLVETVLRPADRDDAWLSCRPRRRRGRSRGRSATHPSSRQDALMRNSSGALARYLPHSPVVLIVTVTMLLPLGVLILYGITTLDGGQRTVSLAPLARVLTDGIYWQALGNTVVISLLATLFATVLGLALGWLFGRTDLPRASLLEQLATLPIFIPPFVGAVAWTLLSAPRIGAFNVSLSQPRPAGGARRLYARRYGLGDRHLPRALRDDDRGGCAAQHGSEPRGGRAVSGLEAFRTAARSPCRWSRRPSCPVRCWRSSSPSDCSERRW